MTDLTQQGNGLLRFDYSEGDSTVITGTNKYGNFSVFDNCLNNVIGDTVTVDGEVTIKDYHAINTLVTGNGTVITEGFSRIQILNYDYPEIIFQNGTLVENARIEFGINVTFASGVTIRDSVFGPSSLTRNTGDIVAYNTEFKAFGENWFNGNMILGDVVFSSGVCYLYGNITLDGSLTTNGALTFRTWGGGIDANGNTIILDYTNRSVTDGAIVMIDHVRNSEICVTIRADQTIGTYAIGSGASQIGQGDAKGVWNPDTNEWDYQGAIIGDLDGIIEIRDENGFLLANCTVNGATEYFGRHNYTVYVDPDGNLLLDIGWNNKIGRTYAAARVSLS